MCSEKNEQNEPNELVDKLGENGARYNCHKKLVQAKIV